MGQQNPNLCDLRVQHFDFIGCSIVLLQVVLECARKVSIPFLCALDQIECNGF